MKIDILAKYGYSGTHNHYLIEIDDNLPKEEVDKIVKEYVIERVNIDWRVINED